MRGGIFAYGPPCPICKKTWDSIRDKNGDVLNIICKEHYTVPEKYAVDGRGFKNRKGNVGRLFRDERGELLYSFHAAKRLLEAIRHDWDKLGQERFDPTRWSRSGRESYKVHECARETILHMESQGKDSSYMEISFRLHINPIIGDIDIRELTEDDIEKLQIAIMKKTNPLTNKPYEWNTVRCYLRSLRTVLNRYCHRKRILPYVPVFPEGWSEVRDLDIPTLTPKEQAELIAVMPERIRLLLQTYAALGCRPAEVCGLKKMDLLPDNMVRIQRVYNAKRKEVPYTKTKRKRTHPLPPELHAALHAQAAFPGEFLFLNNRGVPFSPGKVSDMFREHANKAGRHNVTLYSFSRHSLATEVYREALKNAAVEAAKRIGNTPAIAELHYIKPKL